MELTQRDRTLAEGIAVAFPLEEHKPDAQRITLNCHLIAEQQFAGEPLSAARYEVELLRTKVGELCARAA